MPRFSQADLAGGDPKQFALKALLKITVAADGSVGKSEVITDGRPETFVREVLRAATFCEWEPGTVDGKAAGTTVLIPLSISNPAYRPDQARHARLKSRDGVAACILANLGEPRPEPGLGTVLVEVDVDAMGTLAAVRVSTPNVPGAVLETIRTATARCGAWEPALGHDGVPVAESLKVPVQLAGR